MDFQHILSQSEKSPKSILKIVISLSVALLVIWLFLVSRMDMGTPAAEAQNGAQVEQTEGLRTSLLRPADKAPAKTEAKQEKESPAMFQKAFVTFLVMISILGGVWLWARRKDNTKSKQISRELGGYALGEGSKLKFIEINNEVWVMGVTGSAINLLDRVPKNEWQENEAELNNRDIAHESVQETKGKGDFKSLYRFFTN